MQAIQQSRVLRPLVDPTLLTESDLAVIEKLDQGERTKGFLVDETEFHRNTIGNSLEKLRFAGVIECLHETTALYELVLDPREEY